MITRYKFEWQLTRNATSAPASPRRVTPPLPPLPTAVCLSGCLCPCLRVNIHRKSSGRRHRMQLFYIYFAITRYFLDYHIPNLLFVFSVSVDELQSLLREFHERIKGLEGDKWDLDYAIKMRDYQVNLPKQPNGVPSHVNSNWIVCS